jgi:hypothetical protein
MNLINPTMDPFSSIAKQSHNSSEDAYDIAEGYPRWANYLPDELLLEVLSYIPEDPQSQTTLATFCLVNRQWYNTAIERLYKAPHLVGKAYERFVRTICPSVLAHIRKSELAGLGMRPCLSP